MNRKNKNRLCAGLAFITASICILKLAAMNTKDDNVSIKGYQEPKSTPSSISSEYSKEESDLEKSLVTSDETNEKKVSSSSSIANSQVTSPSNGNNGNYNSYLSKYYSEYIAYINSGKYENKFYLFDVNIENGTCTEVNGLFTLGTDELIRFYPIPVIDALTDEEKQAFPSNKNVETVEDIAENLNKIRTPQEIVEDLNKKYVNKSTEEILKQVKDDSNNNEKYPISLIKIVLTDDNDASFVPVLDLGDDVYYELNGDNLWYKNAGNIRYNYLDVYVNNIKDYSAFNKSFLSVNEIYEVTNFINQDFRPERSGTSRSLTK